MLQMLSYKFQIGYSDYLNRVGWHEKFDTWPKNEQTDYESGRVFAAVNGDRYLIRNMKTPYEDDIDFSDALCNAVLD